MKKHTHQRFELGTIIISSQTQEYAHPQAVLKAVRRHASGEWGEMDAICTRRNNRTLSEGLSGELVSLYRDRYERAFFVITNATRDETRVSLRHELVWTTDW